MSNVKGELSHRFWQQASNSKLAAPEMYALQHQILNTYVLPLLPQGGRLLDVGCADGEFTEVLARDCSEALGIDLSANLIEQARQRSGANLRFEVGDITSAGIDGRYERLASMGLFSCLVRQEDFSRVAKMMVDALQPGGYLVLKDSLMLDGEPERYYCDDHYEAIYREEARYLNEFLGYGLRLVQRFPLARGSQAGQVSVLYVLHAPPTTAITVPSQVQASAESRLKVAILHQLPESWGNVSSLWRALEQDDSIDARVILLPFLHADYNWSRQASQRYLDRLGIPYVVWDELDHESSCFDAVFFTSPYDITRPLPYQFYSLQQRVRFTAYIPYGLEVGGGDENLVHQYGQPVAMHASAVYVRSDGARAMYSRHCPTGDGHVVVSGHPRMDGLADLDSFPIDPELLEQIGSRRAVLWNAHFSFDADQWSTFDLLALDIFNSFAERPDLALLFRPHPLLWQRLVNLGLLDAAGIASLRQELGERGVIIDERPDHRHAFAASCAMMSDTGSFLMEYLVTGKPVLYLVNPHGLGLNEEGEAVVRYYDQVEDAKGVAAFLDGLDGRPEDDMQRRKAVIPEFFAGFDGQAGQRIVAHMKKVLGA